MTDTNPHIAKPITTKKLIAEMVAATKTPLFKNMSQSEQVMFTHAIGKLSYFDQLEKTKLIQWVVTDVSDEARHDMAERLKNFSEALFGDCQMLDGGCSLDQPEPGVFELKSDLKIKVSQ